VKKTITHLFLIQSFWWLLSSCHKETSHLVTPPVQPPIQPSTPAREIVNNNLQWMLGYSTIYAKLTDLKVSPSPFSADSIQAVYIKQGINRYDEVKQGAGGYFFIYYEIENNVIILRAKMFDFFGVLPLEAKVVFR
jgi:hypothetical protein